MNKLENFSIATFNINSVRSRLHILEPWLAGEKAPTILCLQETKCQDTEFPKDFFTDLGYYAYFKGMKSYNGVAILSKIEANEIAYGLPSVEDETRTESENCRVIRATFGDVTVMNTYIPQGKDITHQDYPYKIRFFERILEMLNQHYSTDQNIIWVGDINVARTEFDIAQPKGKNNNVCFHIDVRSAFENAINWGFTDLFREFIPDGGNFTFWDYRVKNSLERNIGWRIDHILTTGAMTNRAKNLFVEKGFRAMERPSDHTAVVAEFA